MPSERIGVIAEPTLLDSVKRYLLYFDILLLGPIDDGHTNLYADSEVPQLLDRGVVDFIPVEQLNAILQSAEARPLVTQTKRGAVEDFAEFVARLAALHLQGRYPDRDVAPIVSSLSMPRLEPDERLDTIQTLTVVLKKFPILDDLTVPYEKILEFKEDPDSRSKFLALRNWMIDISRAGYSQRELEEKIEYLLEEYERHLDFHAIKTRRSVFEVVTITTLEALENIATFKWSKLGKSLFSLGRMEYALMEAERKAPGRELAYIAKARDQFAE